MWLEKDGRADDCEVQKPRKQGLDGPGVMRMMTRSRRWDVGSQRGRGRRQQDKGVTDNGRQRRGGACVTRTTPWSERVSSSS
jgi:hypothetical protein